MSSQEQSLDSYRSDQNVALADFGIHLLRTNPNATIDSMVISPISISIALAMCYVGAKNNTSNQLAKVLGGGKVPKNPTIEHFSFLMKSLTEDHAERQYKLYSANKVYIKEGYNLLKNYKEALVQKFGGQFENVDFNDKQNTANKINNFVDKSTQGKITNLVNPASLSSDISMLLVNALYFKGRWQNEFQKELTQEKDFDVAENRKQKVNMMKATGTYPYYEDQKVQVLGLPYLNYEGVLYIILPKERFGLKKVLDEFSDGSLSKYIDKSMLNHDWITEVDVEIPRFKVETSLSLAETLKKLGITDAFTSGKADFSGISGNRELFIGEVLHKTYISMDEQGTEAAAATAVELLAGAGFSEDIRHVNFHADHPFLYAIVSKEGDTLFTGTVVDFK
uniref:Serpin domain-containing protein n=1 Tax=Acrobeloides nanus TaxID=290746 RepID=A0A914DCN0_9BILA